MRTSNPPPKPKPDGESKPEAEANEDGDADAKARRGAPPPKPPSRQFRSRKSISRSKTCLIEPAPDFVPPQARAAPANGAPPPLENGARPNSDSRPHYSPRSDVRKFQPMDRRIFLQQIESLAGSCFGDGRLGSGRQRAGSPPRLPPNRSIPRRNDRWHAAWNGWRTRNRA